MKRAICSFAILICSTLSYGRDFLGVTPDRCYRVAWKSKFDLNHVSECGTGYSLRSISFKHKPGENWTYQESVEALCCQDQLSAPCQWSAFESNLSLNTNLLAPARSVITGIAFKHNLHENGTHQQSYAIKSCAMTAPSTWNTITAPVETKWWFETEFGCYFVSPYAMPGPAGFTRVPLQIVGIGFSHPWGHNGTHEESVHVTCVKR